MCHLFYLRHALACSICSHVPAKDEKGAGAGGRTNELCRFQQLRNGALEPQFTRSRSRTHVSVSVSVAMRKDMPQLAVA